MPNYKNINKRIENIQKAGFKPVTELMTVQQEYAGLINNNAQMKGGMIRSLQEVNLYRKKNFGDNYKIMSQREYDERLQELIDQYGDKLSVTGARKAAINRAQSILDDYSEKTGNPTLILNVKNYKFYNDKIVEAGRIVAQYKGRGASYNFYEILEDLISMD